MKIAVAQLGARRHYAVPRIFYEAGMLERLFTDSYAGSKPRLGPPFRALLSTWQPRGLRRWLTRVEPTLPEGIVISFDWLGLNYWWRQRHAAAKGTAAKTFAEFGARFANAVVRKGLGRADVVWGFNGASLEIFRHAKAKGLRCILEQTMAPYPVYRRLMLQERVRWPGWQSKLGMLPENDPRAMRVAEEWQLADLIICGSQFVVDAMAECGGPRDKCRIVPYGVDLDRFPLAPSRERKPGDRLRVLFAGEVGLRKGAPYLLESLRLFGRETIQAKFAGRIVLAHEKLAPYRDVVTFLGTVPRSQMAALFGWADLLVLPSTCEGSATVTYEAIASGLPVICTPNTGALKSPAVLTVPQGNLPALSAAIAHHLESASVPPITNEIRHQYALKAYAQRLLQVVRELE